MDGCDQYSPTQIMSLTLVLCTFSLLYIIYTCIYPPRMLTPNECVKKSLVVLDGAGRVKSHNVITKVQVQIVLVILVTES